MVGYLLFLLFYAAAFAVVAAVVWLLFSLIWNLISRVGRVTGAAAKIDRFLDTDGVQLPDEERVKHVGGFKHGSGGG